MEKDKNLKVNCSYGLKEEKNDKKLQDYSASSHK